MKTGDPIWIDYEGRTVEGTIMLASDNQLSLMLGFDAMLGGHLGMMPVLRDGDGVYRSIITGEAVAIAPRTP
jgi:hypothetical protein